MYLTPTEYRILEQLVRNEGRTVSCTELLEAMCPFGETTNNIRDLRNHISRLRKKIEIDPRYPRVIITHNMRGYSLAGKEQARWFPELEV